jgi:hypothetical protein
MNENEIENESSDFENLALEKSLEEKSEKLEYQKYITDIEKIKDIFLIGLCGYSYEEKEEKIKVLGKEIKQKKLYLVQHKEKAFINEQGAYYLFSQIFPLINQVTTTGKLNEFEIWKSYNAKLTAIIFTLLDNYYFEGNSFELKIEHLSDIVSFLGLFQNITLKARGGFTLEQIAQTFISVFKSSPQEKEEKKGLFGIFKK